MSKGPMKLEDAKQINEWLDDHGRLCHNNRFISANFVFLTSYMIDAIGYGRGYEEPPKYETSKVSQGMLVGECTCTEPTCSKMRSVLRFGVLTIQCAHSVSGFMCSAYLKGKEFMRIATDGGRIVVSSREGRTQKRAESILRDKFFEEVA